MSNHFSLACRFAFLAIIFCGFGAQAPAQDEPIDFHQTIKPLFNKYCIDCHGEEEPEVFRIDEKDDTLDYITPGDAADSQLYQSLISDDEEELMPPPDEDNPMSAEEIKLVETWINQGAKWPTSGTQDSEPANNQAAPLTSEESKTDKPQEVAPNDLKPEAKQDAPPANAPAAAPGKDDQRIYRAIGSLHAAATHLPIGLLIAAGLFAFLSLRGNFVMSDCAYYCLWVGALGAIVACITGWWAGPMRYPDEEVKTLTDLMNRDHRLFWHRTGGLVVAGVSILLAMFAASARNRDPDDGTMWKLCLVLLAVAVGWVGHEGGKITHGKNHYTDLRSLAEEWLPAVFGSKGPAPEAGGKAEEKSDGGTEQKKIEANQDEVET
jgi:uncharacterized membrane protein